MKNACAVYKWNVINLNMFFLTSGWIFLDHSIDYLAKKPLIFEKSDTAVPNLMKWNAECNLEKKQNKTNKQRNKKPINSPEKDQINQIGEKLVASSEMHYIWLL